MKALAVVSISGLAEAFFGAWVHVWYLIAGGALSYLVAGARFVRLRDRKLIP